MSDHSEDGECPSSPERPEVVKMNSGCFVLDLNGNEEDDVVLNLSNSQSIEEENVENDDNHSSKKDTKKAKWRRSAIARVMKIDGDEEEIVKVEKKMKDYRRKSQCFNCNGEHNIKTCPVPKNVRRIRENREAFQKDRAKDSRYTEPQSDGNGEFKPGRLSNNLQRALGIGPNDIPEFVYRMRRMGFTRGYPPGYLRNAIVKPTNPSDLLTFHSDNPELKDDKEEGDERSLCPTVDPEKIIHYFGFNQTCLSLNDKEQFSVPPLPVFMQYLNDYVEKEFWEEKKRVDRKRKASTIEQIDQNCKKARNEEDNNDCLTLNAPPPPRIIVMDEMEEEKKEEEEISMGDPSLNLSSIASPSTNGTPSSRRFSVGTPVLQRKKSGDGMKKVPSLDAFAVGIIPFQTEQWIGVPVILLLHDQRMLEHALLPGRGELVNKETGVKWPMLVHNMKRYPTYSSTVSSQSSSDAEDQFATSPFEMIAIADLNAAAAAAADGGRDKRAASARKSRTSCGSSSGSGSGASSPQYVSLSGRSSCESGTETDETTAKIDSVVFDTAEELARYQRVFHNRGAHSAASVTSATSVASSAMTRLDRDESARHYIGVRSQRAVEKKLTPDQFFMYYDKPAGVDIPVTIELKIGYMTSTRKIYHFPIQRFNCQGEAYYAVMQTDTDVKMFPSIASLVQHYHTFSHVDPETGSLETFGVPV